MPKLKCLTSMRVFAALLIVIHHSVPIKEQLLTVPILREMCLDHGVSFFFVLSGFILTYVYHGLQPAGYRDFFVARFARLWPAHIATLTLGFFLGSYGMQHTGYLALNAAMMQSWWPVSPCYFSYNGVSWSISTEFGFYLAFPFLIRNLRDTWHWKLFGAAALLAALIAISQAAHLTGYDSNPTITYHGLVYVSPAGRLLEFVLGMCACQMFLSSPGVGGGPIAWTVLEVAATALAFGNSCSIGLLMGPIPAANEYLVHSGSLFSMALVVYVFARQRGYLARFLSLAPFVYLGEISFSIYLLHMLVYNYLRRSMPESVVLSHLILIPLLFGSAALMHFAVESPMRALLKKWLSKPIPKPVDSKAGRLSNVPLVGAEQAQKTAA
jgi:peptidoglycan/LPS O-acetylase OafA/YrhL